MSGRCPGKEEDKEFQVVVPPCLMTWKQEKTWHIWGHLIRIEMIFRSGVERDETVETGSNYNQQVLV